MSVSTVSSTSCGGNSAERAFSITGDASPAPATARLRGSALTPIPPGQSARRRQASVPESRGSVFPGEEKIEGTSQEDEFPLPLPLMLSAMHRVAL